MAVQSWKGSGARLLRAYLARISELLADILGLPASSSNSDKLVVLGPVLIVKVHRLELSSAKLCHQVRNESSFGLPRVMGRPDTPPTDPEQPAF